MDIAVARKLAATGMNQATDIIEKINAVERQPRHLDGPPDKFRTYRVDQSRITPFGVYRDYSTAYKQLYGSNKPKDSVIVINGEEVNCSYRTLIMLKSLIYCGVCRSADRATACKELFGAIISRRKNGQLTEDAYIASLRDTGDYHRDEIVRAILDNVFTDKERIEISVKSAMKDKYNKTVLSRLECNTVDEYDEEITKLYKKACADPDFKVQRTKGREYNALMYLTK